MAKEWTESCETASGNTESNLEIRPVGDLDGGIFGGLAFFKAKGRKGKWKNNVHKKSFRSLKVSTNGIRTITALDALPSWLAVCFKAGKESSYIHAGHAQDSSYHQFRPSLHLQFLHQENWQNAHSEVAHCGKDTVNICHGDNDFHVDTGTFAFDVHDGMVGHPGPEKGQWLALQEHQ